MNLWGKFNYVKNEAFLHTDELMPNKKELGLAGTLYQMEKRHV